MSVEAHANSGRCSYPAKYGSLLNPSQLRPPFATLPVAEISNVVASYGRYRTPPIGPTTGPRAMFAPLALNSAPISCARRSASSLFQLAPIEIPEGPPFTPSVPRTALPLSCKQSPGHPSLEFPAMFPEQPFVVDA